MEYGFRKTINCLNKIEKIYLFNITSKDKRILSFYKELNKVLKTNKVKYFQLRLKKYLLQI